MKALLCKALYHQRLPHHQAQGYFSVSTCGLNEGSFWGWRWGRKARESSDGEGCRKLMEVAGDYSRWRTRSLLNRRGPKTCGTSWQGLARVNGTYMAVIERKVDNCWDQIMVILYIGLGILILIDRHWRNIKVFWAGRGMTRTMVWGDWCGSDV